MLAHFGGWGWGGWDDNVPWLAHRHAERWSGLPALGLHTCWPILVGGGGVGGMITYHKALLQYYSALQSTTPYYKVLLESATPVPLFTTKYNSSTTLYYSSTTPHQTLCSGCLPKFQPMLRLPTKVTLQHHQIMRLPQEVKLQHDQILRLPRKVTLQQFLRSQATKTCGHKRPKLAVTSDPPPFSKHIFQMISDKIVYSQT